MRFIEKSSGLKGIVCSIYWTDEKYHYLSIIENYEGLIVYFKEDIEIVSDDEDELVSFKNIVYSYRQKRMHPVLLEILKEDWDLYRDIVEGCPEEWAYFMKKMDEFEAARLK